MSKPRRIRVSFIWLVYRSWRYYQCWESVLHMSKWGLVNFSKTVPQFILVSVLLPVSMCAFEFVCVHLQVVQWHQVYSRASLTQQEKTCPYSIETCTNVMQLTCASSWKCWKMVPDPNQHIRFEQSTKNLSALATHTVIFNETNVSY